MKMMKLALLGGAALAVTAAGAQADDLSALKAEIEALNSRVAQLEATPSVPAGYSLMTVTTGDATVIPGGGDLNVDKGSGKKATIISVLPTADAPATTTIEWSGYARAAVVYSHYKYSDGEDSSSSKDLSVPARLQIKVVGKTDTAVGEVGASIKLRANFNGEYNPDVYAKEAWGWWAMTPELTLGGGYTGSLGNIGYGYDGACNCYYTDNADVELNPGDTSQIRLTYATGPFTAAVALEDASGGTGGFWSGDAGFSGNTGSDDSLGVAGEIKYTGDVFNGEISGLWRKADDSYSNDTYAVGAGGAFALGDMATISAGAQIGKYRNGTKFWRASILGSVNLSDAVHAEVAYGHTHHTYYGQDVNAVLAGIYYDPVSQLTIGLEGEWFKNKGGDVDDVTHYSADLVTVFRF
ncbi:hypothetical protein [Aestuariivirga sp.]|uniref:hypothetical protein n=1 Tax=Aestuariivirga sp. TaxID=2650926 RepID=UPI0039E462E0